MVKQAAWQSWMYEKCLWRDENLQGTVACAVTKPGMWQSYQLSWKKSLTLVKSGEEHVPTASVTISMLPLGKTPQEKQSEREPHNLILQLQKIREDSKEKEMEVMEKTKLEKKAEHQDYVLGGANREIKLQTLEKAALSRAKEQALSSLQKAQAELKKHQKEKKVLKAKQSEIMRSKLYRSVRKLKVVHSEDLQQKQTLEKQLHDTTKEISTLKK